MRRFPILFLAFLLLPLLNHSQGPPPSRKHTVTRAGNLKLIPANEAPPEESRVSIEENGTVRQITSNAIPSHRVGAFPNRGNPNRIRPQAFEFELPAKPEPAASITYLHDPRNHRMFRGPMRFGVALNGLLFDPGAAEFYLGDASLGWQYEPLSGAISLGLDENHAHVQPTGSYHYHGLPVGLMKRLGYRNGKHSPLIGWAADGFPIYAIQGYSDSRSRLSRIVELKSSYRLKKGRRPGGDGEPGGAYDGAFVGDYEFVNGAGDLDECNGRFGVTPEFPDGTYAYFLTRDWPVIPRAFRGTPVSLSGFEDHMHRPPPPHGHKGPPPGSKGKGKGKGKGFPPPPRPR